MHHGCFVKASGNDVSGRLVRLDVAGQNCIQHLVGRQAILVLLVSTQFSARWARDDSRGDRVFYAPQGIIGIALMRHGEYLGFENVFYDCIATRHVAVECAIARCHFALIACRQHDAAEFVGQRHQQGATDTGL